MNEYVRGLKVVGQSEYMEPRDLITKIVPYLITLTPI